MGQTSLAKYVARLIDEREKEGDTSSPFPAQAVAACADQAVIAALEGFSADPATAPSDGMATRAIDEALDGKSVTLGGADCSSAGHTAYPGGVAGLDGAIDEAMDGKPVTGGVAKCGPVTISLDDAVPAKCLDLSRAQVAVQSFYRPWSDSEFHTSMVPAPTMHAFTRLALELTQPWKGEPPPGHAHLHGR